jgi:N-acyl-D-aspartate/D-glutamate deacylase
LAESSDLVIRNATVYDGTGAAPRKTDVSLRGDRILALGELSREPAARELDASGLALAPGFIDVHTHDDFAATLHPEMGFKVLGGVTTCVVGNCGFGAAPHREAARMARAFHPHGELPRWDGYAGYMDYLDREPPSVNVGVLMGHGTIRAAAMGNQQRMPDRDELAQMSAVVREGLEAGALGLSTGLIYEPGRYAETDEIVALAALMQERGAIYTTHMRDEGNGLLDSVREAIEIGERAGVAVQISHHKASGRSAWGLVAKSLELIEGAQARGLDVHADQYPYTAGSTVLAALVQNNSFDAGGGGLGESLAGKDVVIASAPDHSDWDGRSLESFHREFGGSLADTAERVLNECPLATVVLHSMSEDDVRLVMRHPSTMIGSDGIPTLEGKPHPRLYGSFARVLGHYARDLGLFPLEDAVHRMTGMAARKFGLKNRGVVRAGAQADLVLFDPQNILDTGTFEDPNQTPAGIPHVFVNGVAVVSDGNHTGARPGQTLRR